MQDAQLKKILRLHYRRMRQNFSLTFQYSAALQLAFQYESTPFLHSFNQIGIYLPVRGEIGTQFLIETAWRQHKKIYLPKLQTGKTLQFYLYADRTSLTVNRWGILEPEPSSYAMPLNQLQLLLLPLVAFDTVGRRLGQGMGYYDRTLAGLPHHQRPLLIGLAYECQKHLHLPNDHWDIPLDGVLTEKGFRKFS